MPLKLLTGAYEFSTTLFPKMQELFEDLVHGQHPEALFITCCDSRINPCLISQTYPGDLFVHRNPGNIIPPHPVMSSEAASIEYAIDVLKVKYVVVCGHSQCGAMKALQSTSPPADSAVTSWIEYARPAVTEDLEQVIKNNVLLQIEHLKTHPAISRRLADNNLIIQAWYYEFGSGKISVHDARLAQFVSLEQAIETERNAMIPSPPEPESQPCFASFFGSARVTATTESDEPTHSPQLS